MAYKTNHFCWQGVVSTDPTAALAFYNEALPLSIVTADMAGEPVSMLASGEVPFAHLVPPQQDGVPSHWESYLRVHDVDASAARAAKNGGAVLVPAFDIPPGRMAVVASPSGATFNLFHEADEAASVNHPGDSAGSVHWTELWSKDLDADLAWLTSTFDLELDTMEMPDGPYFILLHDGEMVGGAMRSTEEHAPSMWLTWLRVDDLETTLTAIGEGGGETLSPVMDVPGVGRMAVVQDPAGAVFGVITPGQMD